MDDTALYESIPITLYNSLSRSKEPFVALNPPFVGMYVCGPTVYSDPHLGHARPAIAFDTVFRYLRFLGLHVRYVRNITDVGHLEDEEAGAGEDRIAKRARLERIEPMEVVQRYTLSYHDGLRRLGCLPPSIEPRASGHIIEQIEIVKKIIDAGLAYEVDGSVYFDLEKYARNGGGEGSSYGRLSGRVLDDLLSNTRGTAGAEEKRSSLDFALWKRAESNHIMRWKSPWGDGFPGWHVECTTMSTRYLGEQFDIHGGGLDLQFPHHEAEIAQSHGAFGCGPARYWMHNNMLTVDGRKMARSLGNFITLEELFTGNHERLDQTYHPMVVRFFALQAHYRSVVDFSNDALKAAEKGYRRLMAGLEHAETLIADEIAEHGRTTADPRVPAGPREDEIAAAGRTVPRPGELAASTDHERAVVGEIESAWRAMSDDFHTPTVIAALFELSRLIQRPEHGDASEEIRLASARFLRAFSRHVLGLKPQREMDGGGESSADGERLDAAVRLLIDVRGKARSSKDFETADRIRDSLADAGIRMEDHKDGSTTWTAT